MVKSKFISLNNLLGNAFNSGVYLKSKKASTFFTLASFHYRTFPLPSFIFDRLMWTFGNTKYFRQFLLKHYP